MESLNHGNPVQDECAAVCTGNGNVKLPGIRLEVADIAVLAAPCPLEIGADFVGFAVDRDIHRAHAAGIGFEQQQDALAVNRECHRGIAVFAVGIAAGICLLVSAS